MPAKLKPRMKHPYNIHKQATRSKDRTTPTIVFVGTMEAAFQMEIVLRDTLFLPSVKQTSQDGYRFQQDNDF